MPKNKQELLDACDRLISDISERGAAGGVKSKTLRFELEGIKSQIRTSGSADLSKVEQSINEINDQLHPKPAETEAIIKNEEEITKSANELPVEPHKIFKLEEEIIETQKNFINRLQNYYDAYTKLKAENGPLFRSMPAWIDPHMEYIHQIVETGQAWMNEPRKEATAIQRIQAMLQSPLFMEHLRGYEGKVIVEFEMMQRWMGNKKTISGRWIAAMEAKIKEADKEYYPLNALEGDLFQRPPRFEILLKEIINQANNSHLEQEIIDDLSDNVLVEINKSLNQCNQSAGMETIYRKVNAELNRAGASDETIGAFSGWINKLNRKYRELEIQMRELEIQIGDLKSEIKVAQQSNEQPSPETTAKIDNLKKLQAKFDNLKNFRDKIEEKIKIIEAKFDTELNKILESSPPGSRRYAAKVDSLVNKTICPLFSHLDQRIDDRFKDDDLSMGEYIMKQFKTLMGRLTPERSPLELTGIFKKTTREPSTPMDIKMEPDSSKDAGSAPVDKQAVNSNARHTPR